MFGWISRIFFEAKQQFGRRKRYATSLSVRRWHHIVFTGYHCIQSSLYGLCAATGNASSSHMLLHDIQKGTENKFNWHNLFISMHS